MEQLTDEQIADIHRERAELEGKWTVALSELKRKFEAVQEIANKLHDNGCRWCGKSDDEDYKRLKPLTRADDMLMDLPDWFTA